MRMKKKLAYGVLVAAVAAAVTGMTGGAAAAGPGQQDGSVTSRVDRALLYAEAAQPTATGPTISSAGGQVRVASDKPSASIATNEKSVRITLVDASSKGSQDSNFGRVYGDTSRDTDIAIRTIDSGVQMLAILHSPTASNTQRYRLDVPAGTDLQALNGGYALVQSDGTVAGIIAAPWATDATGRALPTSYSLEGTTLVQTTDTTGASFPVVVDPKITFGFGIYLNMWGHEVRTAAAAIVAIGGVGAAVACTLIGRLPNQFLKTLATLVCGAAAVNLQKVFAAIVRTYQDTSINDGACYQQKITSPGSRMTIVRATNCI